MHFLVNISGDSGAEGVHVALLSWVLVAASANQFKVFHCEMGIETWKSDLFETHNFAKHVGYD